VPRIGGSASVQAATRVNADRCRIPGAIYTRTSEWVQRLQAARQSLQLPQALAKLDRYDLIIVDDLSYVRKDQAETSVLFELISERYERRSILITANQPFSGWDNVFPDPGMTVAAIGRLVHHSTIFELNHVESYRGKEALRRQRIQPEIDKANCKGQSSKDSASQGPAMLVDAVHLNDRLPRGADLSSHCYTVCSLSFGLIRRPCGGIKNGETQQSSSGLCIFINSVGRTSCPDGVWCCFMLYGASL